MPNCNRCHLDKPVFEFHSRKDRHGYQYTCKSCKSLYARKGKERQKRIPITFHHSTPEEIWKTIPDFDGYLISNKGRVRSIKQSKDNLLNGTITQYGYKQVGLYDAKKRMTVHLVHILVADAFLGKRPSNKHQVNHIDFDKHNNAVTNLEYVTAKENIQHNVRHGRQKQGEECHTSKLTAQQVKNIRLDSRPVRVLAIEYQVTLHTIRNIRNRRTWKHVK